MLCSRKFFNFQNITKLHNLSQLNSTVRWRSLHTTSILSEATKNHDSTDGKIPVYFGSLSGNIRSVKVFSLTTSFAGVIAQPMLYEQATKAGTSFPLVLGACSVIGFFTFVTPFLLHYITKKYVTELHFDPKTQEYIATVISFFLVKQHIKFRVEDVTVPEVPGMFTSFLVKSKGQGKPVGLFVDPKLFDDPSHYVKIMGYDKPIDFRFEEAQGETRQEKK